MSWNTRKSLSNKCKDSKNKTWKQLKSHIGQQIQLINKIYFALDFGIPSESHIGIWITCLFLKSLFAQPKVGRSVENHQNSSDVLNKKPLITSRIPVRISPFSMQVISLKTRSVIAEVPMCCKDDLTNSFFFKKSTIWTHINWWSYQFCKGKKKRIN